MSEGVVDQESAWAKLGNNMMDIMDRQVTGILRQPALWTTYFRSTRENYAKLETQEMSALMSARVSALLESKGIDVTTLRSCCC
jgi:hypothetical protein